MREMSEITGLPVSPGGLQRGGRKTDECDAVKDWGGGGGEENLCKFNYFTLTYH